MCQSFDEVLFLKIMRAGAPAFLANQRKKALHKAEKNNVHTNRDYRRVVKNVEAVEKRE